MRTTALVTGAASLALSLVALALATACTPIRPLDPIRHADGGLGDGASADAASDSDPDAFVASDAGPQDHGTYVVSALRVPTSRDQARLDGLDLDGDGAVDDALGSAFALVASMGGDVSTTTDTAIARGDVILLVETLAFDEGAASARVLRGTSPMPAPCDAHDPSVCGLHLAGGAHFEIIAPVPALADGTLASSHLDVGAATFPMALMITSTPTWITLSHARLVASISPDGLTEGVLAGAIGPADLADVLVPAMYQAAAALIARDCDRDHCTSGTAGAALLAQLDTNHDGAVTLDEYRSNALIQSLLAPDLDLLAADGSPGQDGSAESLSMGVGFDAVPALFDAP